MLSSTCFEGIHNFFYCLYMLRFHNNLIIKPISSFYLQNNLIIKPHFLCSTLLFFFLFTNHNNLMIKPHFLCSTLFKLEGSLVPVFTGIIYCRNESSRLSFELGCLLLKQAGVITKVVFYQVSG